MEAGPMRAIVEVKVATAIYELRIHDDANQINEAVNEVVNEGEPLVNRDDEAVALFSAYVSELPSKSLLILGMCANQELTKREIFGKLVDIGKLSKRQHSESFVS